MYSHFYMQKDRGMRILQTNSKLSLVLETLIVFYNCISLSYFTRINMASDFFSKMVQSTDNRCMVVEVEIVFRYSTSVDDGSRRSSRTLPAIQP